jgi:hypothetical protein
MVMYIIHVKPFKEKYKNKLEIFNEGFILLISYHLLFFTDYIKDEDLRTKLG